MAKHLNEENFDELINSGIYLVDFYADWCGPCKMLSPILDQIDFVEVIKVNVDKHPELATRFGVMSIPTMIFFKDGRELKKEIGFRNIDDIKSIYQSLEN